jgi:hypothetical protein
MVTGCTKAAHKIQTQHDGRPEAESGERSVKFRPSGSRRRAQLADAGVQAANLGGALDLYRSLVHRLAHAPRAILVAECSQNARPDERRESAAAPGSTPDPRGTTRALWCHHLRR